MAAIALVVPNRVSIVEPEAKRTSFAGAAITAGQPVRYDANGKFVPSLATTAPNGVIVGIAVKTVAIGEPVTALMLGAMDGWDFSALAYGDPVYLADAGGLGTVAGTVSIVVGRVHASHGQALGLAPDKILNVNL